MANVEFPWLGEPGAHDPRLVGGKSANLSLLAAEYRVPPGFCIPPSAFEAKERLGALVSEAYAKLADETGTGSGTTAIKDGQTIEVDGNAGEVRILA